MKMWLIQRAKIRRPLAESNERIGSAVNLDYMGSAEFEFGALPKSLRALQACDALIKLRTLNHIKDNQDRSLRVLSFLDDKQFVEYNSLLIDLRADKVRLKEWSKFAPEDRYETMPDYVKTPQQKKVWEKQKAERELWKPDFWWDIDNHTMFSFDKEFMARIHDYLASSWAYMDEQKKAS